MTAASKLYYYHCSPMSCLKALSPTDSTEQSFLLILTHTFLVNAKANSIHRSKIQRWGCTWVEQTLHYLHDRRHLTHKSSRVPSHFFKNRFSHQYNTSVSPGLYLQIKRFSHLDIRRIIPNPLCHYGLPCQHQERLDYVFVHPQRVW